MDSVVLDELMLWLKACITIGGLVIFIELVRVTMERLPKPKRFRKSWRQ